MRSTTFIYSAFALFSRLSTVTGHPVGTTGTCAVQPAGSGPQTQGTAEQWLANPIYQQTSDAASTPSGYTQVLKSSQSSIAADAVGTQFYLGYEELTSYDVEYAANACRTKYAQCTSFNIYFERNPIQDPGKACPDPNSTTRIKVSFFSTCITGDANEASNNGQYCADFHIVISGSNAYTVNGCKPSSSTTSTTSTTLSTVPATTTATKSTTTGVTTTGKSTSSPAVTTSTTKASTTKPTTSCTTTTKLQTSKASSSPTTPTVSTTTMVSYQTSKTTKSTPSATSTLPACPDKPRTPSGECPPPSPPPCVGKDCGNPPPPGCTGKNCGNPPPPGCTGKDCGNPPPPGCTGKDCGNHPPPGCTGKDCGNPSPPPSNQWKDWRGH